MIFFLFFLLLPCHFWIVCLKIASVSIHIYPRFWPKSIAPKTNDQHLFAGNSGNVFLFFFLLCPAISLPLLPPQSRHIFVCRSAIKFFFFFYFKTGAKSQLFHKTSVVDLLGISFFLFVSFVAIQVGYNNQVEWRNCIHRSNEPENVSHLLWHDSKLVADDDRDLDDDDGASSSSFAFVSNNNKKTKFKNLENKKTKKKDENKGRKKQKSWISIFVFVLGILFLFSSCLVYVECQLKEPYTAANVTSCASSLSNGIPQLSLACHLLYSFSPFM